MYLQPSHSFRWKNWVMSNQAEFKGALVSAVDRAGAQGRVAKGCRNQALRDSPNAYGLPVLEKCLHVPRNDPTKQSDYIIFSSHQCTVMVPDAKRQNLVCNSALTLALTDDPEFLTKVLFPKYSFSFLSTNKGLLVGNTSHLSA